MRLMFLAYRRGLLQEDDNKFGLESRIRETLLMDTIVMEHNADLAWKGLQLSNILLAPNIDRKRFREQADNNTDKLKLTQFYYNYDLWNTLESEYRLINQSSDLIKLWNKLVKDGTLKAFKDSVDKKHGQN